MLFTLQKQKAGISEINKQLTACHESEQIAWEINFNSLRFDDFQFFNSTANDYLGLENDINPLLVINGKQCQPCIDELLKIFLDFEDSLKIINSIKIVFLLDTEENPDNVNFLGKYFLNSYCLLENQLEENVDRKNIPDVFLLIADNKGRSKSYCEYNVNFSKIFLEYLNICNEKYYSNERALPDITKR